MPYFHLAKDRGEACHQFFDSLQSENDPNDVISANNVSDSESSWAISQASKKAKNKKKKKGNHSTRKQIDNTKYVQPVKLFFR